MYILDKSKFKGALKERGFRSIGDLADFLGIHRNSIHHYLSGNGVFPENFEKIINALGLKPEDILIEKEKPFTSDLGGVAPIIDELQIRFPEVTFVLFGSRAKKRAQKYSDWDIGIYSKKEIDHEKFRKISRMTEDLFEDLPYFVDIINLNEAGEYFLREISRNWKFLAGKLNGWVDLQRKVAA